MKSYLILLLVFCVTLVGYAQTDTVSRTYRDVNDLKRQIDNTDIELFKYVDSTFSYEIMIPQWLTLRETSSSEVWGGTLPPVNGIENAIVIKGFSKKRFKSFKDFKNTIIEKDVFGQPTQMSANHIFMGKKLLDEIPNVGPAYVQYHNWNDRLYDCQFVLTETKSAYLWIIFTATRDTYEKNLDKFEEFVKGFKAIE